VAPLPIALMMGWLSAATCGTPPVRAGDLQTPGIVCPCSPSTGGGSALQHTSLADTAQAPKLASASQPVSGPSRVFRSWSRMANDTQAKQPDWLSPIATTSGRLKQEFRYDVWRQTSPSGEAVYTLGGGKGLELIVAPRVQILIGIPSYVNHMGSGPRDGFGDTPLMLKFRLASAARGEGDYLLTLLMSASVPTGSRAIGMHDAVLSPGIAFGKGWGRFDVQSTVGPTLPTGDTARLGRQLIWNTALQYRARWKLWPELEVNSTSYLTGKNAGETQTFLTPGVGFGRAHLWRNLRFSAGAGLQIAVTPFHTYNHQWMFSNRISF
jgi:hypothetical protein